LDVIEMFYHQYRTNMRVNLVECLQCGPLHYLEEAERRMKQKKLQSSFDLLGHLEGLHSALVVYMWMRMRSPVAWSDPEVTDLKDRTELALDWCLRGISWGKRKLELPDIIALRQKRQDDQIVYHDRKHQTDRRVEAHKANSQRTAKPGLSLSHNTEV